MVDRFVNIIRHRPTLSLAFAVLILIATGSIVAKSGRCLKTKYAPGGIVSLELAWNQLKADTIRNEWNNAYCNGDVIRTGKPAAEINPETLVVNKAKQNILDDIYFLIGYPLFFIICIVLCDSKRNYSSEINRGARIFIWLAIASGLLDAVENYFMWKFLNDGETSSVLFALPATIKFVFVLLCIGYILVYLVRASLERIRG